MRIKTLVLFSVVLALFIAAFSSAEEKAEKKEIKPVLLVIDVQNVWMPMMAEDDRASAPAMINKTIALFREFGLPVVRVYHSDPERGPEPGTEPFAFSGDIATMDDDPKIVKNYSSSFTKTDLEKMLREKDRNTVVLCGLSATGCVLATYYGAMDREFLTLMVKDALLSGNSSHTDVIEEITYCVTLGELREILEKPHQ